MPSYYSSLASVALFATTTLATPVSLFELAKRDDTFEWGAIGDSWASGVTAKPGDNYKAGVNDPCLITNYAYAAQLEKDDTW